MSGLSDSNSLYVVISSPKINDMISILYAKEYQILPIKGYYHGKYEDSVIAWSKVDNDTLRQDILQLLQIFHQECAIVKYRGETGAKKIFKDGSEKPLGIAMYNTDSDNVSYLYNGVSFSFVEQNRYWKPTKKEDFKVGMLVEYFNKNEWFEKEVKNIDEDYEKFFKLLIKYDKLRVMSK